MSNPTDFTLREAMREVIDPEIGINIVDLGLIYAVTIAEQHVTVTMTMTTPSCPMGGMLQDDVQATVQSLLGDDWQVDVELVWEPPWSPGMMSEDAREHFGWEHGA